VTDSQGVPRRQGHVGMLSSASCSSLRPSRARCTSEALPQSASSTCLCMLARAASNRNETASSNRPCSATRIRCTPSSGQTRTAASNTVVGPTFARRTGSWSAPWGYGYELVWGRYQAQGHEPSDLLEAIELLRSKQVDARVSCQHMIDHPEWMDGAVDEGAHNPPDDSVDQALETS